MDHLGLKKTRSQCSYTGKKLDNTLEVTFLVMKLGQNVARTWVTLGQKTRSYYPNIAKASELSRDYI